MYALRIITDVGLRALSPAINDPTTAVRALDEVEAVLRAAAPLPLGPVRIRAGAGSVVVRGATWNDIVDLGIWEVLEAGLSAPQVTRRISALLSDLLADLPADRHAPLLRYRRRLHAAVTESVTSSGRRAMAGRRQSGHRRHRVLVYAAVPADSDGARCRGKTLRIVTIATIASTMSARMKTAPPNPGGVLRVLVNSPKSHSP